MCQPAFLMRLLLPNKACYSRTRPVTLESDAYDDFHFLITGGYASTFVFAILEILDSKKKGMLWNSRLYCFGKYEICSLKIILNLTNRTTPLAAISFVGLFTSLIITLHWIPPVNSVFDHPVEAPRLIQWLTTTPLLTFMMYSLDVRSDSDVMLLWFSVCLQQFSVLCGIVANFTTNYTVGVIFMVFAAGSVVWIIASAFLAFRRIGAVVEEAQRNEEDASAAAARESGNKPTKQVMLRELKPEKISSILASEENLGVIISFQITLYSAFFWALTAAVFFSGLFRVLSPELESALQSFVDLLMKCFYAQALCSSHGYVLSPEGILMKLLLLEEKAHATFRQVQYILCTSRSSKGIIF